MNIYSTIFFVDGAPVGYTIIRQDERILKLNPAENPSRTSEAPHITAERINDDWRVKGTNNPQLVSQVLEELNRNKHLLAQKIKVAP